MADYCTLDNVQGWLEIGKKIDNQSGDPNAATVGGWITDFSGDIDVALSIGGVPTPVTDASWLKRLRIRLARELAYQVQAVRGAFKDELKENLYLGWHQEYLDMIKLLEAGKAVGVLTSTESGEPWSETMDGRTNEEHGPKIKAGQVF